MKLINGVREARRRAGWSQADLARRVGLSRAAVSAIETGRVEPSTAAALALGSVFGVPVEALFQLRASGAGWAWPGRGRDGRYWLADVEGDLLRYPSEPGAEVLGPHDGTAGGAGEPDPGIGVGGGDPYRTLVVAGCDPAALLLAHGLAERGIRVLSFVRSSGSALDLLRAGAVHVAGIHLGPDLASNEQRVRETLGPGYRLVHVTRWSEGLAAAPDLGVTGIRQAVGRRLRWAVREPGSGARRCLDEILTGDPSSSVAESRAALSHSGVAEAIRSGWADVGVCVEVVAAQAGLDFHPIREEAYDLVFKADQSSEPRIAALLATLRSRSFQLLLAGVPGYDVGQAGSGT